MKKTIISTLLFASLLSANEIQVFTTNTKHIKLDKNTKIAQVAYCAIGKECKNLIDENSLNGKFITTSAAFSAVTASTGAIVDNNIAGAGGADILAGGIGSLAGIAIGATGLWVKSQFKSLSKDNEYIVSSLAKNSKGEETLLMTLIVTNDEITEVNAIELASINQNKLLK